MSETGSKNFREATAVFLLSVFGMFAFVAIMIILDAFVLKTLWLWFVVPTFGLNPLSIPVTIGLVALFHLAIRHFPPKDPELSKLMISLVFTPVIALLIGWVAKLFI